uniref:TaqI-like C-terminal specificity domain-containing protein n=1 Tax=Butyrivibrio sp. TaxID=28121 RepID=UPI0025FE50F1
LRDLGSRKNAGSYYTPTDIVIKSVENLKYTNSSSKSITDKKDPCSIQVLDPCCGSGNFLIQMPDLISPCNIYGCDIDPVCVCLARINLALKYGPEYANEFKKNVRCANFLKSELSDIFAPKDMEPDIIIGNPPWGFDFSMEDKKLYKSLYKTAKGKGTESYDIFTEKAISCLKENGRLSFVLPEASLTVKLHNALREIIISNCNITYLAYLGNVFHKVACPCVILQLLKTGRMLETKGLIVDNLTMSPDKDTPKMPLVIGTNRKVNSDKLSFYTDDEEYAILEAMSSLKRCTYLKDNATFALGIVTGDNDRYIKETPSRQAEIILKGSDISRYYISKPGRYIVYKPESFQQVAPKSIYRADEKLFYRFISNDLIFAYDNEGLLSLNSCNILIPRIPGLSIKYIMAILNSSCARFYYKKSFNSVKVLRSHLEQIPIPLVTKNEQDRIVSLADRIIQKAPSIYKDIDKGSPNDIEVSPLYEELDAMISSVYGLTPSQHKRINAKM